jgi:hypothetical protein
LSFVSSAFDLKSLLLEATVCGTSSSLLQVTVVPADALWVEGELIDVHLQVRSLYRRSEKLPRHRKNGDRKVRPRAAVRDIEAVAALKPEEPSAVMRLRNWLSARRNSPARPTSWGSSSSRHAVD